MPAARLADRIRERFADLSRVDAPALAARLTLLSLLLAPIGASNVRPWVLIIAAAGLLAPRAAESALVWSALAALAALRVSTDWPLSDNHAYLLAAWCLALAIAFATGRPRETLGRSARQLIALAFALAVFQKLIVSPDYLDGTFFRWLLAADSRFEDLGVLLGRDEVQLATARDLLAALPGDAPAPDATFAETPALRAVAFVLTWTTLIAEGAVALAFLLPRRFVLARDATLLLFCTTTFAIAPVAGFGWILLAMGVAQTASARTLYLVAFALLVLYREVPWLAMLASVVP